MTHSQCRVCVCVSCFDFVNMTETKPFLQLGRHVNHDIHDVKMDPIDFEGQRSMQLQILGYTECGALFRF